MLTADTITDEQIRELQQSVAGLAFPAAGMAHTEASRTWETCQLALEWLAMRAFWRANPSDDLAAIDYHATVAARARCAEIINARAKAVR